MLPETEYITGIQISPLAKSTRNEAWLSHIRKKMSDLPRHKIEIDREG